MFSILERFTEARASRCLPNRATQQKKNRATIHTYNAQLEHDNSTTDLFAHHGYSNPIPASKPIVRVQATKRTLRNHHTTRTRRIACTAQPSLSYRDTHLRKDT